MFQHHKEFMLAEFIINFLKHIKNYKQVSHFIHPQSKHEQEPHIIWWIIPISYKT